MTTINLFNCILLLGLSKIISNVLRVTGVFGPRPHGFSVNPRAPSFSVHPIEYQRRPNGTRCA